MQRLVTLFLTLLTVALPCLFLLPHLNRPVALAPNALDTLQAIRYSAAQNRLGTQVVRPLEARVVLPYGDGALPDLGHAPLYQTLGLMSLKVLKEIRPGQGQRALTALGLTLLVLAGLTTHALFRHCFPERSVHRAVLFFVWSSGALLAALTPGPTLLVAVLGGLLCLCLLRLDVRGSASRAPVAFATLAGLLWGLLFLSLYSALLLLPVLVWHLIRVTRRDPRALLLFLGTAALVAAPQLVRTARFAHNPLYHSRWAELAMRTSSFPGEQLYHSISSPSSLTTFLPNGGVFEVAAKSGKTLAELVPLLVGLMGLALPLFAVSSLIRFADNRVNGLRNLVLVLLPLHAVALSFFFPAEECAGALLLYAPAVCVLGSAFLETVIRARRLPRLHSRAILTTVTAVSLGLGLTCLIGLTPAAEPLRLYSFPGPTAAYLEKVQLQVDGIFLADDAPALAFATGVPTALLPASTTDFRDLETRLQKPVVCFALTPALRWDRRGDRVIQPWSEAYRRILGLFIATEALRREDRDRARREIAVTYPEAIFEAVKTFQVIPIREAEATGDFSALFWDTRYTSAR